MNPYVPIIVMIVIAALLAGAGLVASRFLGPQRYNSAKLDRYESGLQPTPGAAGGGRVPIKYYLVAIMTFLLLITIPFIYEWRRGGFEWD